MMTHDKRNPLNQGDKLALQQSIYEIREVVGFGGSCLAYRAEREPDKHEREVGMPCVPMIIKEFYPIELAESITRTPNNELTAGVQQETFDLLKNRFEQGAVEQAVFSISDGNHSLPLPAVTTANGTAYTAVVLTNGKTLADCAESLSMLEKSDVLTSLCNAVKKLHDCGKLYLDLKPSNIFVFDKELNETRRIALFDFDTVIPVNGISDAMIAYSDGWSPYEQRSDNLRNEISYASDIYAIGAVYYWLLSGNKTTDYVLNEVVRGRFEFLDEINGLGENRRLKETIGQILSATLKRVPDKRAQRVEDILL